MSIRRTLAAALASAALVLVGFVASAPAQAAIESCPGGAMCMWGDTAAQTNGLGYGYVSFQRYIPNFAGVKYRSTRRSADNSATSLYNNGHARPPYSNAYLYKGPYGRGEIWKYPPDTYYWNLAVQTFTWNDTISSGYFYKWAPRK